MPSCRFMHKKSLLWSLCALLFSALSCTTIQAQSDSDPTQEHNTRIAFNGILLGGFIKTNWVSAEDLQDKPQYHSYRIWGGNDCTLYSSQGYEGQCVMTAIRNEQETPFLDVNTPPNGELIGHGDMRLVLDGQWNATPRQAQALSPNNQVYRNIVKKYLERQGLSNVIPNIMQLYRVDLEGDGVDEIVITAQNVFTSPAEMARWQPDQPLSTGTGIPGGALRGNYSLILLRKNINGRVLEIPLLQFIALKDSTPVDLNWTPPRLHKIYQFADLNGDGILEILAGQDFYEGNSYRVFEVRGRQVKEVLVNGQGA